MGLHPRAFHRRGMVRVVGTRCTVVGGESVSDEVLASAMWTRAGLVHRVVRLVQPPPSAFGARLVHARRCVLRACRGTAWHAPSGAQCGLRRTSRALCTDGPSLPDPQGGRHQPDGPRAPPAYGQCPARQASQHAQPMRDTSNGNLVSNRPCLKVIDTFRRVEPGSTRSGPLSQDRDRPKIRYENPVG
jgi:hypothetical protein